MTGSTANKPDGIYATVELGQRLAKFFVDSHPAELFLTEQNAKHPTIFNAALQQALMNCGLAFTPGDLRLKRFAVQDQKLIEHCLEINGDKILASACYQSAEQYASRPMADLVQDLTLWNNKDKPRAEVLFRLQHNPDCVSELMAKAVGQTRLSFLKNWFNPLVGDSSDECLKIVSIIIKSPDHRGTAPYLLPDFEDITEHTLHKKDPNILFSYLNHLDDPDGVFTEVGVRPITKSLSLRLVEFIPLKELLQAFTTYATRNSSGILAAFKFMNPLSQQLFRLEVEKIIGNSIQAMVVRRDQPEDIVDLIVSTSFLANQDFKYTVSHFNTLADKLFCNKMVPVQLLSYFVDQYRKQGQCSDLELVKAAGDELFKYSVISKYVSLQYFVDHAKDKIISEQILGQDLGL